MGPSRGRLLDAHTAPESPLPRGWGNARTEAEGRPEPTAAKWGSRDSNPSSHCSPHPSGESPFFWSLPAEAGAELLGRNKETVTMSLQVGGKDQ